jgi:hypothetical protein
MSSTKPDLKEIIDIAKMANIGGVLGALLIGAVVAFVAGSGCGPVKVARTFASERLFGSPVVQDHPEAYVPAAAAEHGEHGAHGADEAAQPH